MNNELIAASHEGRIEDVKRLLASREEWDIATLLTCIRVGRVKAIDWIAKKYGQRHGIIEASFRELIRLKEWQMASYVIQRIPPFYFPYINYLDLLVLIRNEDRAYAYSINSAIEEVWKKTIDFLLEEDENRIQTLFPIQYSPEVPEEYGSVLTYLIQKSTNVKVLKWAIDLNPPYDALWWIFGEKDIPELNANIERELVERPQRDMVGMDAEDKSYHMDKINRRVKYTVEKMIRDDENIDKVSNVLDIMDELRERLGDQIQLSFTYAQICKLFELADEDSDLEKYTYGQLVEQPYDKISEFLLKPEVANWVVDYLIDQVAVNERYQRNPMYMYLVEVDTQLQRLLSAFEYTNNIEGTLLVIDAYRQYKERIHPLLRQHYQDDDQYQAAVEVGPIYDRDLIEEMVEHSHRPRMLAFWLDQLGSGPVRWDVGRNLGAWNSNSQIREQNRQIAQYETWSMMTNPEMRRVFLDLHPTIHQRVDQMRLAMVRGLDPQNPGERQLPTELRARINQFL